MPKSTIDSTNETKLKTAATYNAASDVYDDPVNSFWDRFGRSTVERLELANGARVLDVCCGSGASAVPAAEAVGPTGSVLGVDLAENLLALATRKAKLKGLSNVEFRRGDLLDLDLHEETFDAVICVFGIFFVPDMEAAMRQLWRFVRPGGKLAITTWGPRFFEPGSSAFWNSIRAVRPDLHKSFNPWDRISEPAMLQSLFLNSSIENFEVVAENVKHELTSPGDWWAMVLGTGYRGTVEQLNKIEREKVRLENLDFICHANVNEVEANVLYGVANKTKDPAEEVLSRM